METNSSSSDGSSSQHFNFKFFLKEYGDIVFGTIFLLLAFFFNLVHNYILATFFSAFAIASFSVTVAEISEIIAHRLGEPYGSFILTFTAVVVEIILLFSILLQVQGDPSSKIETVKSGIISAVIVDINFLLGLAIFVGGLSFKKQEHNQESSSTYGTILFVSASALLVPSILNQTEHMDETLKLASHSIAILLMVFYIGIVIFQTKTHSHFFKPTAKSRFFRKVREQQEQELHLSQDLEEDDYFFEKATTLINFLYLFGIIFIIGFLAEIFSHNGVILFNEWGISGGLAGLIIAIISVAPEIFTAVRAAQVDEMQRVVNIAMGASVVSIMLTVPILVIMAMMIGINLTLDFNTLQVVALFMTVVLVWKTTDDGETNYFEGISHIMFFVAYAIIASFY